MRAILRFQNNLPMSNDPFLHAPVQTCLNCGKDFKQGYATYFDGTTSRTEWLTDTICHDCEQSALFSRLSADQQQEVDELIYGNAILQGIKLLRTYAAIGLKESTVLHSWRYRKLKESNPRKFPRSDEQYWDGFYS